jgi:hypothetical protein
MPLIEQIVINRNKQKEFVASFKVQQGESDYGL